MTLRSRVAVAVLASASVIASCGPRAAPVVPPPAPTRIALVVSEESSSGFRLIAISENGDRQFEVVQQAAMVVRDQNPAISPDGKWLVFASSRGRDLDGTSLWIAPLGIAATPRALTDAAGIDSHPTWTPDGTAIVFASSRGGAGDATHLWRVELDFAGAAPQRKGALVQLTTAAGFQDTPSVAADGSIYYSQIDAPAPGSRTSALAVRAPDGTTRALTTGPADASPALSPDGKTIAFARPTIHDKGGLVDGDIWTMPTAGGAEPKRLAVVELTDESGPVWSRDGRYVFATSLLRGADGRQVYVSVISLDTRESPVVARILEDHAGPTKRLTPAVNVGALDDAALRGNLDYLAELKRIVSEAIDQQAAPSAGSAPP